MRISEALHITFDDIDLENRNITIPGAFTKNGNTCHTYFTEESKDALLEWLKERETYLKYSFYKSKYVRAMFAKRGIIIDRKDENSDWTITKNGVEISNNDLIKEENRIFPFSRGVVEKIWNNLLEKTGHPLNEKVHDPRLSHPRYKFHIHTLRKFFTGSLSNDGVPEAFIDKYVNHTEQYHGAYKSKTHEELREMYEKHCNCLAVFSDLDKVHKQITPKLQEQDIAISSLTRENVRLHSELENDKFHIDRLQKRQETDKFQIDKLQESVKEIQKILLLRTGDRTEDEIKKLKHHGLLKDED